MTVRSKRSVLFCSGLLVLGLFATPALAVDALFSGSINRFHYGYYTTFANIPTAAPAVAATQGATGPRGFTIANKAVDAGVISYTAMFTGYPYFKGTRTRYMTNGDFSRSFKVPSATYSIMRPNTLVGTQYPNALPSTPAPAYMKVQVGANGFGGFWGVYDGGTLTGVLNSLAGGGGGYSDFFFRPSPAGAVAGLGRGLDHDGGANNAYASNPQTRCCQYSLIDNQTFPSLTAGILGVRMHGFGHVTGMVTVSGAIGAFATKKTYTGVDGRTASGLLGSISMVAPGLIVQYTMAVQPTFDQATTVNTLNAEAPDITISNLTFLPEPSQAVLLGVGILGIGALRGRRR